VLVAETDWGAMSMAKRCLTAALFGHFETPANMSSKLPKAEQSKSIVADRGASAADGGCARRYSYAGRDRDAPMRSCMSARASAAEENGKTLPDRRLRLRRVGDQGIFTAGIGRVGWGTN